MDKYAGEGGGPLLIIEIGYLVSLHPENVEYIEW